MTYLTEEIGKFGAQAILLKLFIYKAVNKSSRLILSGSPSRLFNCLPRTPGYDVHVNHRVYDQE